MSSPSTTRGENRSLDSSGTTKYAYSASGQLLTEDGPFSSDTVTNTYANRLRTALSLQQPTGSWTNGFIYTGEFKFKY